MKSKTSFLRKEDIQRKTFVLDADNQVLGRLAARAAHVLRGKHKPTFAPYLDMGDQVIIINAAKVRVTGKKATDKIYQRYSGYPSGQKSLTFEQLMAKSPETVVRLAIGRMLPKGRLGNRIRKRIRVYRDAQHPHNAQKPEPLSIEN